MIEKVAVKLGDTVKRGDLLIEIDAKAARLAVQQAEANLGAAEAKNKYAELTLKRYKQLYKTNAIEERLVEERTAQAIAAKQDLELREPLSRKRASSTTTRRSLPRSTAVSAS